MKISPKKSLGQHLLLNPSTIDKILRIAHIQPTDHLLEIGPGPGAMTKRLAACAQTVVAVEKDRRFVESLKDQLSDFKNVILIEGDILNLQLEKILPPGPGKWKVVANLPYNIATEVIFHLLEPNHLFVSFTLMVQREVAHRLVASPGTKDYGILSIFSQLFSKNRIVMRLPPGAFTPPPKVDSAVVEFQIDEGCRFPIHHLPTFETVVRSSFEQRRKMIRNSLAGGMPQISAATLSQALKTTGILPEARAETVPIGQFVKLANEIHRLSRP